MGTPLDPQSVLTRLEALRRAPHARQVYGADAHEWALAPRWSSSRLAGFEQRHGVALPDDLARWLTAVGAAGAGPGCGILEPGTLFGGERWEDQPDLVAPLGTPFPHTTSWNLPPARLAELLEDEVEHRLIAEYWRPDLSSGSLPLAQLGRGVLARLVISGAERGRIWVDERTSGGGLHPEEGLDFAGWIEAWLYAAEQAFAAPPKPIIRPSTGRPERTRDLPEALGAAAEELCRRAREAVSANRDLVLGGIGVLRARGRMTPPFLDQGPALRVAVRDEISLVADGPAAEVFSTIAVMEPGVALHIPGLFTCWIVPAWTAEILDYLGRDVSLLWPRMLVISLDRSLVGSRRPAGDFSAST